MGGALAVRFGRSRLCAVGLSLCPHTVGSVGGVVGCADLAHQHRVLHSRSGSDFRHDAHFSADYRAVGILRSGSHSANEPAQDFLCDHVPGAWRRDADQRSHRRGYSRDRVLVLYSVAAARADFTKDLSDSRRAAIFCSRFAVVSASRRAQPRLSQLLHLVGAFRPLRHGNFRPLGALVLFYCGRTCRFFPLDPAAAPRSQRSLEKSLGRQNTLSHPLGCFTLIIFLSVEIQVASLHSTDLSGLIDFNGGGSGSSAPSIGIETAFRFSSWLAGPKSERAVFSHGLACSVDFATSNSREPRWHGPLCLDLRCSFGDAAWLHGAAHTNARRLAEAATTLHDSRCGLGIIRNFYCSDEDCDCAWSFGTDDRGKSTAANHPTDAGGFL